MLGLLSVARLHGAYCMCAVCRYAWYKLYNLAKGYNKNLAPADVQMLAGNVLLSALAIPPYSAADAARSEADAEQEKERSARIANLLGFTVVSGNPRVPKVEHLVPCCVTVRLSLHHSCFHVFSSTVAWNEEHAVHGSSAAAGACCRRC